VAQESEPSAWSIGRFGRRYAEELWRLVPQALTTAVNRQIYTHQASGLDSLYAYGGAWPAVYEELVNHVGGLDGVQVVRPRGKSFRLVLVNSILVVPFRYSDDLATPVTDPRTTQRLNKTCQDLLAAFGPGPSQEQGELFPVPAAKAQEAMLGDVNPESMVMTFFAANAQAGLLAVGWGEAALRRYGNLRWKYHEAIPLPKSATRTSGISGSVPVSGQRRSADHRRFDEAPLPDPSLNPRTVAQQRDPNPPVSEEPQRRPLADDA
jgi:hypothetical protein